MSASSLDFVSNSLRDPQSGSPAEEVSSVHQPLTSHSRGFASPMDAIFRERLPGEDAS